MQAPPNLGRVGFVPICPDTGNKLFLMPADPMYFLLVSGFETLKSAAAPT